MNPFSLFNIGFDDTKHDALDKLPGHFFWHLSVAYIDINVELLYLYNTISSLCQFLKLYIEANSQLDTLIIGYFIIHYLIFDQHYILRICIALFYENMY